MDEIMDNDLEENLRVFEINIYKGPVDLKEVTIMEVVGNIDNDKDIGGCYSFASDNDKDDYRTPVRRIDVSGRATNRDLINSVGGSPAVDIVLAFR